jgi:hypothetical protein
MDSLDEQYEKNRFILRSKQLFNAIVKYRYIISLIIFIFLVIFKVNGSSVDWWSNYIDSGQKTSIVAGKARSIRSDEWEVLLPIYLSQVNSPVPFQIINPLVTSSGQNVLITMGAPIKDIYSISKPLHWGILFLGANYGVSWYWNLKLILIILLSFELCMIITKGNKVISFLGSFWIAFSPAVQWWFVQHVGDNVLYFEAIIVSFYYFLHYFNRTGLKILFALLFALSCVGYVTPLYPPLQITFGFLCIIMMILIFTDFRKKIKIQKLDILIISCIALFIILMLVHLYMIMKDAIPLMNNTAYPGKRVSTGGGAYPYGVISYLIDIFLPYGRFSNMWSTLSGEANQCEISSFYNFLPAIFFAFPIFINRRKKSTSYKYGVTFLLYSLFFLLYSYRSIMPSFVAKMTLLSYVVGKRAILAYTFPAMLLSIWALAEICRLGAIKRNYAAIVSLVVAITYFVAVRHIGIRDYRLKYYAAIILVMALLSYLLLRAHKYAFSAIMIVIILASGATVNPINIGINTLTQSPISLEIQKVRKSDPNANWMSNDNEMSGALGVLIYANGAKSLSGINNYPDYKKWSAIDPDKKYSKIYNRSAHITFSIVQAKTNFQLVTDSVFNVNINVNDIKKLNVKYIVSSKILEQYNNSNITFKPLFKRDNKNYTIYEVVYHNS